MNLWSWTILVFLLSAGTSLAAVNVNWLTRIVEGLRREYTIADQFCLAANIPRDQEPNNLGDLLRDDRYIEKVKDKVDGGDVYKSNRVVVAKCSGPEHAERQVLRNLDLMSGEGNFLLIYSYLSPCGDKCTNWNNRFNILKEIQNNVVPYWTDFAFVFTKVYDRPGYNSLPGGVPSISRENLTQSLYWLRLVLDLRNIFRCYKPENLEFQCHSCSSRGRVSDVCVDNNAVPRQTESSSRSSSGSRSRSRSRSRSMSSSTSRNSSRSRSMSRKRTKNRSQSESSSGSRSMSRKRTKNWSQSESSSGSRSRSRSMSSSTSRSSSRSRSRSMSSSTSRNSSRSRSMSRKRTKTSESSSSRGRDGGSRRSSSRSKSVYG